MHLPQDRRPRVINPPQFIHNVLSFLQNLFFDLLLLLQLNGQLILILKVVQVPLLLLDHSNEGMVLPYLVPHPRNRAEIPIILVIWLGVPAELIEQILDIKFLPLLLLFKR